MRVTMIAALLCCHAGAMNAAHAREKAKSFVTGNVSGTVFRVGGGKGIPAARLYFFTINRELYTGPDGEFALRDVPPGEYKASLFSSAVSRPATFTCAVRAGMETLLKIGVVDDGTVEVQSSMSELPAAVVRGRVLAGAGGNAVPGARVVLGGASETTTDSTGFYEIDGVPAGVYTITAIIQGCPLVVLDNVDVGPGSRRSVDLVEGIPESPARPRNGEVARTGVLSGFVSDQNGIPVAAALLTLETDKRETYTDEQGFFRFSPVPVSCHSVRIAAGGMGEAVVSGLPVAPGQVTQFTAVVSAGTARVNRLEIIASTNGMITGTVRDENGDPVPGARVSLTGAPQTTTDSTGVFSFVDLVPQDYGLTVDADGRDTLRLDKVSVVEGRAHELALSLMPVQSAAGTAADSTAIIRVGTCVVRGAVTSKETGKAFAGATVSADGTGVTCRSDSSGRFLLSGLPEGSYSLSASADGYAMQAPQSFTVRDGDTAVKTVVLVKAKLQDLGRISVASTVLKNTDAGMLAERQKALSLSDAISGIEMSRAGASNAADAMKKVTGATIMDGKYVYVRGLGERYNITLLDGVEAPSPDPDKQAVPLDIFPAPLIDNIATIKAATADMSANWAGGCLDIRTKALPEKPLLTLTVGAGANTITTFRKDFLTYDGGRLDWLAIDDGTRAVPERLADTSVHIPKKTEVLTDRTHAKARLLDTLTKTFTPVMGPHNSTAPLNQSYSLSLGNTFRPGNMPLGFIGSLSYGRKYQMYNNGEVNKYQPVNPADKGVTDSAPYLEPYESYHNNKSQQEVLWGGMGRLSFEPFPKQVLQADYLYVRHGQDIAQEKWGLADPSRSAEGTHIVSSMLDYIEQALGSFSLKGTHGVPPVLAARFPGGAALDWRVAYIDATQNEPDLRYFYRSWIYNADSTEQVWAISNTIYTYPTRYFRSLNENTMSVMANGTIPIPVPLIDSVRLKTGYSYKHKNRTFRERRFFYNQGFTFPEGSGDPAEFLMADSVLGMIDTTSRTWKLGNFIVDAFELKSNYHDSVETNSAYLMADLSVNSWLRLSGGARLENVRMYSASEDTNQHDATTGEALWYASLKRNDILPSISCIITPRESMNFRLSYSQTVLHPSIREITPYSSFDFKKEKVFYGNTHLQSTMCYNYDARWEWFYRPGQVLSASLFYKYFVHPIDPYVEVPIQLDVLQPMNAPSAYATGVELEARAGFDFIHPALKDFSVGGNLALIRARTKLSDAEKGGYKNPEKAPSERDFFGASPYVVNTNFQYSSEQTGVTAGLFFNLMGERIAEILPDGEYIYETPLPQLDFVCSYKFAKFFTLKTAVYNILNNDNQEEDLFMGAEALSTGDAKGITFSLSLTFTL